MLTAHLTFSISTGAFSLYRLFRDAPDTISQCIADSDSDDAEAACKKGTDIMKGVMVGLFIVVWLIEICESIRLLSVDICVINPMQTRRGLRYRQRLLQTAGRGGGGIVQRDGR